MPTSGEKHDPFTVALTSNNHGRTGRSFAASSKWWSRRSASSSTPSSSTDSGPSASSESPWLYATRPVRTSTLLSSALNPHPTLPALAHFPLALVAGDHPQATLNTTIHNLLPRTVMPTRSNTPMLARLPNRSHFHSKHLRSRSQAPHRKSIRTVSKPPQEHTPHRHPSLPLSKKGKTIMSVLHRVRHNTLPSLFRAPTSRSQARHTRHSPRQTHPALTLGPR